MLPCPRCGRENPPTALACGGCRMPLALGEEPAPAPLDAELRLDRRGRVARPAGEAATERSSPEVEPDGDRPRPDLDLPAPEAGSPPQSAGLLPASPARRVAAWAIDGALVAAVGVALPAALFGADGLPPGAGTPSAAVGPALLLSEAFVAVLAFVYATAAHALAGATLGKRVARIRVVGWDGRPPAPAVSARRSAWAILSIALAGAGLLPALLLPSRRALHDLLAGTRVVEEP